MRGLTQAKTFFDQNGYVVIPDLLNRAQLSELTLMLDRVLDGEIKPELPEPDTGVLRDDFAIQWEPGLENDASVARRDKARCVFHLCHTHPFFQQHATRSEILDVVEALIGPNIRLYTDQTFVKPAHHGSEVPFHQDSAYWPAAEPKLLSCWLAIDDATVENGCVRMIPGSHKRPISHREFDGAQQYGLLESDVDAAREVPVEIPAGSAMFHHSLTVHRSFPNHSDHSRRGIVSIYLPADLRFLAPWPFAYGFKLVRGRE